MVADDSTPSPSPTPPAPPPPTQHQPRQLKNRRKRSRFTSSVPDPPSSPSDNHQGSRQTAQPLPHQPPPPPRLASGSGAPQLPPSLLALRARTAAVLGHSAPTSASTTDVTPPAPQTQAPPAKRRRSRFGSAKESVPTPVPTPVPTSVPTSFPTSVPTSVPDDYPPPPPVSHARVTHATGPSPSPQQHFQSVGQLSSSTLATKPATMTTPPHRASAVPVTDIPTGPVQTLRINRQVAQKRRVSAVFKAARRDMVSADPSTNPFHDKALFAMRTREPKRAFADVTAGAPAREADLRRARAAVAARRAAYAAARLNAPSDAAQPVLPPRADSLRMPRAKDNEASTLKGTDGVDNDTVPLAEWWDEPFLEGGAESLRDGESAKIVVREARITHYIHHPPRIEPSRPPPAAAPELRLMLTKQEAKRLRRQRRAEQQQEARELVAAGLAEPPPPKVKLSNVVRVMGTEASVDPTKVEAAVRAQVEARRLKHEADNEARKKTPLERREKRHEKREKDRQAGLRVAVFRVGRAVQSAKVRYKIGVNATQNDLSGVLLLFDPCNVVVVEGGAKALQKYKKLMLRRIDWNIEAYADLAKKGNNAAIEKTEKEGKHASIKEEKVEPINMTMTEVKLEDSDVKMEDVQAVKIDSAKRATSKENAETEKHMDFGCVLVWEGELATSNFKSFTTESLRGESACRTLLRKHNVEHYWDLCTQATPLGNDKLGVRTM